VDHIGIDLGGRESQVCVRTPDGAIREERRLATAAIAEFLADRPPARVIVEACTESMPIADAARAHGHDVRIVAAQLVRSLGVGARRTKTDRRDAQALSAASCRLELPSIHLPSLMAREQRTLCSTREALVGARTQLVNTVRGWLRQQGHTAARLCVCVPPAGSHDGRCPIAARDRAAAADDRAAYDPSARGRS
jgi:transposase